MLHAREDYNRIQDPEGKIPDDEPVFLLRGQDKLSHWTVKFWTLLNVLANCDAKMTNMAWHHSRKMKAWQPKKKADL